jgi:hypothetical protein
MQADEESCPGASIDNSAGSDCTTENALSLPVRHEMPELVELALDLDRSTISTLSTRTT